MVREGEKVVVATFRRSFLTALYRCNREQQPVRVGQLGQLKCGFLVNCHHTSLVVVVR